MKKKHLLIIKKSHLILFIISLLFVGGVSAYIISDLIKPATTLQRDYFIFVDLTEHRLYVTNNGKLIKKYPIASGKYDTPSPIGDWIITHKSNWGEGFGGHWLGLNVPWGKYGIHGTTQPHSIGWRASHGCIRMFNKDAAELARLVPVKTKVKIYGGPYGPFGMGFRTLHPGDRGSDVYEVQVRLKRLGYFKVNPNGIYGEYTKKAVFMFQKNNGLQASNYIDKRFYEKLNIILFE